MKRPCFFPGLLLILSIFLSCEKNNGDVSGDVELFLIESFETIDQSCGIEISSVEIKLEPLISYSEIKSYNSKKYTFKISDKAREAVEGLEHSVFGLPLAFVANDEVIYTAYFWPSYSSGSCQWVVIDPLMVQMNNKLTVSLGYPGPFEGITIPDMRNSPMILDIFQRDKKLID